jgi:tetratricopeptide (TPR) repeat protein
VLSLTLSILWLPLALSPVPISSHPAEVEAKLWAAAPPVQQGDLDEELQSLLAEERAEADENRRRGRLSAAIRMCEEHLEEDPDDGRSGLILARCRHDQARYDAALGRARHVLGVTKDTLVRADAARIVSSILCDLGRYGEALSALEPGDDSVPIIAPGENPLDAWALGQVHRARGDIQSANLLFEMGRSAPAVGWEQLLAKGRCLRGLGYLVAASRVIVEADQVSRAAGRAEADVLAELAGAYFESEREVEASGKRSAGLLYREALDLHPTHAGALLGQFALHRYNRRRQSRSPAEILQVRLDAAPNAVPALVAKCGADLSDGALVKVRKSLKRLSELAPERRDVQALRAGLLWVEHRREQAEALLEKMARAGPLDSRPERAVGTWMVELYRFTEAVPFLERAVARDASDHEAWTQLALALANTGDELAAAEALDMAEKAAAGRQDARRNNLAMVLERMRGDHVVEDFGELRFSWRADAGEVLRVYLVPFYEEARKDLAQRYGHTPEPTLIEVFRRTEDFSVRSVLFPGFPALGVCFGPVVTAVSPLSQLRGNFSWARTGFHEFSHVVHLGLSHNRCPRWITEGLATWEEVRRDPSWTRNMRRILIDARANHDLIPVRELNRAFRGPRILFGYYQGGLLCEMLIDDKGFAPMVGLLEAFDEGLDLDQAFARELGMTPEEVDADFRAFVDKKIAGLALEPRWTNRRLGRLTVELGRNAPEDEAGRERWIEGWTTIAYGRWQHGKRLDAEQALRRVAEVNGMDAARVQFLLGEIALSDNDLDAAKSHWLAGLDAGGLEFKALVGLAAFAEDEGEIEEAMEYLLDAQSVFPGYEEDQLSAELRLANLHGQIGNDDEAMAARERWLDWNPGKYDLRLRVGKWHVENGRHKQAVVLFDEANQVDPFRRDLHRPWADSLFELERWEEALREYRVTLLVPANLDPDHSVYVGPPENLPDGVSPMNVPPQIRATLPPSSFEGRPLDPTVRAALLERMALCSENLGRPDEASRWREQASSVDGGR